MARGHVRSVHSLEGEPHGNECICLQFPRAPPQSALGGREEEVEGEREGGVEEQRWVQMTNWWKSSLHGLGVHSRMEIHF